MPPVPPKPASSVVLVREAPGASPGPLEVYMIRRNRGMRFLGGYYAFPGGKVGAADGAAESLERCFGLTLEAAEAVLPGHDGAPALSYWVTAVRELLEETGILLACDNDGAPVDVSDPSLVATLETCRKTVIADETAFAAAMASVGWRLDLRGLRYLAHFITPTSSPIRFTCSPFLFRDCSLERNTADTLAGRDHCEQAKTGTSSLRSPCLLSCYCDRGYGRS